MYIQNNAFLKTEIVYFLYFYSKKIFLMNAIIIFPYQCSNHVMHMWAGITLDVSDVLKMNH